ncbi:MAG: cupin domain-containing protein [Bacteroides sp.]
MRKLFIAFSIALAACTSFVYANPKDKDVTKKTRSEIFIHGDKIEWEPAGEGVKRQILGYDGQVMLVKIKFEKGAVGAAHAHYHTQTTYVVSGKFEFTIGGEKKIVSGGDGLYMEPDILHGCVCLEPGVLIDCFAPMRADFLK